MQGADHPAVKLALDPVEDISELEVVVNPIVAIFAFKLERYWCVSHLYLQLSGRVYSHTVQAPL